MGGGGLTGGDLDDEDYFAGQVKLSDTSSELDGNGLLRHIDVGQRFAIIDRRALGRSMSSPTASSPIPIGNAACPVGLWWCRSRPRSSVRLRLAPSHFLSVKITASGSSCDRSYLPLKVTDEGRTGVLLLRDRAQ